MSGATQDRSALVLRSCFLAGVLWWITLTITAIRLFAGSGGLTLPFLAVGLFLGVGVGLGVGLGLRTLARRAASEGTGGTSRNEAFRIALALPQQAQQRFMMAGFAASLLLAGFAWFASAAAFESVLALALCGVTFAAVVAAALFYGIKRAVAPTRKSLAHALEDPEARARAIRPVPLQRKAAVALVTCAASAATLAFAIAGAGSSGALDRAADDANRRLLAAIASAQEDMAFEDAVEALLGDASTRAFPTRVLLFESDAELPAGLAPEAAEWIGAEVDAGRVEGVLAGDAGSRWAFRSLDGGGVAVARSELAGAGDASVASWLSIVWIALVALGSAMWLAREWASDVRDGVILLVGASERMTRGDLRRDQTWESEDELGQLWRAHESMGNSFRETVRGLTDAADRLDTAAAEIESVSRGVAGASGEQVRRIQQASELMVSINREVMEVAGSAQELNVAVEESSSSILELGAAGDELNETATVLGTKVDEVSGSIEQMVRSVKQVSSSSDGLADAAAETSASMEEMASAMRAVDTTAELTADLSRGVVASAESGQQKVSQTIDGMQAIRDATDTAENVIRGLGARTQEIGAILDVIDDVAEETNLLALNAAIIAAQAGEHGRAFSVVADEIKELADRVLASTKEIGSLIKSVQDESDNAVGAIEVGSRSVASGVELSAEAGLSLEEITRSSRESGQRIGEIVSAVREQTKAASHVVALMDTVRDGVTAIVSAAADQDRGNEVVYRSSVTMRDVTQQVRRTTEEQSRGFVRIRENVEGVREVVENINRSLQEQSTACSQVAGFLEQVFERTRSNEDAAGSMSQSVQGLVSQAETLRDNVAKFQV